MYLYVVMLSEISSPLNFLSKSSLVSQLNTGKENIPLNFKWQASVLKTLPWRRGDAKLLFQDLRGLSRHYWNYNMFCIMSP